MNIAIMSCEQIKDEACIGCQRCLTAMHRREGELERTVSIPEQFRKADLHLSTSAPARYIGSGG